MAKRKAEGSQRGGKAPERPPPTRQPPPPPPQEGDSDSDVCEIVSPPPSSNPPRQKPRPPSMGFSPASGSHHRAHASAGFLPMMPRIPVAGFGLSAAGQGTHFGYHQPVQAATGFNPYLFAAPQLFPPQSGLQGRGFPGAPTSLPVGASPGGGASSGASEVGKFSPFGLKSSWGNRNRYMCLCCRMWGENKSVVLLYTVPQQATDLLFSRG